MKRIEKTPIENIFAQRFGRYSKYIIQERALPDVRDGLKPVQRRILYAMNKDNNTFDKQFRKSAKTVGNVIGNYHPHGDTSVYEAMVRMSQNWKTNEQLVIMHGNNGSIDGDNPAAMRYTEAKLSEYSNYMLTDIYKETVSMVPNFDDTELEPSVLPTRVPNLLINGTSGIASGYATEIPPHNITEVLKAAILVNENKDVTVDDIMKYIKAPDFPTGGIIQGVEGIKKAYETGRGKLTISSKYEIIKNDIIISEIPYDVNKATLLQKIEMLKINKQVEGISEIVDQSDQTGLEIKISCIKNSNPQSIMNFLLKQTDLQKNYNFNMIAIANKKPKLMSIKEILEAFIAHREDVITKRSEFLVTKAKKRLEVVEGLIIAIENLDRVVEIIRGSSDKQDAKNNLQVEYSFSEIQAEAIVTMQLYRLTNTDIVSLEEEYDKLRQTIEDLTKILNTKATLKKMVSKELNDVLKDNDVKRHSIVEEKVTEIIVDKADLIKEEKNILVLTKSKYIKRTNLRSYLTAKANPQLIQGDEIQKILEISNKDNLIIFFDDGSYALLPAYEIEENKWKDIGKNLSTIIKSIDQNKVVSIDVLDENKEIVSVTKQGYVLRFLASELVSKKQSSKIKYHKQKPNDSVQSVSFINPTDNVVFVTDAGKYQVLSVKNLELTSIKRVGKKILKNKKEEIVFASNIKENLLMFSNSGYYAYTKKEDLAVDNYRFSILYKNIKTSIQEMSYFMVDVEKEFLCINEDEYTVIELKTLNNIVPGDKIKQTSKINKIDCINKKIEVKASTKE